MTVKFVFYCRNSQCFCDSCCVMCSVHVLLYLAVQAPIVPASIFLQYRGCLRKIYLSKMCHAYFERLRACKSRCFFGTLTFYRSRERIYPRLHDFNFWKLFEGGERGKDAQGTIKILMDTDFASDLAHFLRNIGGAQLNIGVAEALQRDIKLHLWIYLPIFTYLKCVIF